MKNGVKRAIHADPPTGAALEQKPEKSPKLDAFLIAVKQGLIETRVYAVLAATWAEAVAQVESRATAERTTVEFAGKLSKTMARSLRLVPGERRLI